MNDLNSRIADLSPAKRALLELKLNMKGVPTSANHAIPRRANSDQAPLSFAQQRLWFLDQLEPGSPLYNIPKAIRLRGPLNVEALKKAFDAIVARHEILRTNIVAVDGNPVQVVTKRSIKLPVIDLSERPDSERPAKMQRLINAEARRPFDLSSDLMLRATLIRLSEKEHALVIVLHHIASDGWSMGVLLKELSALYKAFAVGNPNPLPELPIQYADYAIWQRQWLQDETLERQLSYWKQRLSGAPAILELPTDRPRPTVQSLVGARQSFRVPRDLTEALKKLSQQERVTLFMTLLAAFQTLLYRYTGQENLVVGSPIAGRTRAETESLIGFFVNTLVLRTELSGNLSFRQLMARVREVALEAYTHQDLPFEKLVEELQPDRSRSHTPLFQVIFALQNVPRQPFELTGLTVSPLEVDSATAKFDLSLFLVEEGNSLRGSMEYNSDLFEDATITRMLSHYQTLLQGIVANPEQRLADLPILTEREKHQLLVEWNDTKKDYPRDKPIHELFETQVERCPDAVAVIFENQRLTYRELDQRANKLARYLRKLGVGPEVSAGICLERSLEMVIATLGVLKAGGAYAPMDPAYPMERLAFMLDNAEVQVLLTQSGLTNKLPKNKAKVVCLDTDWEAINREKEENLISEVTADNLAYVIYTSGSTGEPKGVCIPHRGVIRLVKGADYTSFSSQEVFLQFAPISFDASTFEIWASLLNGARLIIFPAETPSLQDLGKVLEQNRVTVLWLTAGLFHQMVEHNSESLKHVRQLLTGGDVLSVPHVRKMLEQTENCRLINGYGPTESTTFTSCYPVPNPWKFNGSVPIGRPIANTQVYVLDHSMQPVPIGVPGELYIGGDGLARGYLNCPELTADKFVPDPFNSDLGLRMYKTGDCVRYLPDGNIEFIGRNDYQVKIRGFRVELAEIEAAMGEHPHVRQVIVLAREDMRGEKQLVAYVVADPDTALTAAELRSFAKTKLPDYMIPSAVVFLDALPLAASGKIDRRALPVPEQNRRDPGNTFVASRDPLEQQLTNIWEKLLGVQPISVRDNFFDLGGHSLLALRLMSEVEKKFGRSLGVAALFQAPTVEQLADLLRHQTDLSPWSSLVPLQCRGSRPPFFWVHGESSDAFLPRYLAPDQPVYGLRHQSEDGKRALYTSVEDIAAHYLEEIRTVQPQGPYFLGGYCFGGLVVFEMAQQLQKQDQKVALLLLLEPSSPRSRKLSSFFSRTLSKFLTSISQFGNELHRHSGNLAALEYQQQLLYILQRVNGKIKDIMMRIMHAGNSIVKKLSCQLYLQLDHPLPPTLRSPYILGVYRRAMRSYIPQPYSGSMILFRIKKHANDFKLWCKIATGGVEIHEVPSDHMNVLEEPQVRVWAEQLKECLHIAQTTTSTP